MMLFIHHVLHHVLKHLECPVAYARLLFIDFSSAFSMIQPHSLQEKLVNLKVKPSLIYFYYSFLTNKPCTLNTITYFAVR